VFDAEPDDRYVLPNSPAPLLCKAKFVSKLNFSCTGGLVPKEIYRHQNDRNVTTLLADVTHVMIKANALDGVSCVCLATGYSGVVLKSRSAAVTIACKSWLQFFVFPCFVLRFLDFLLWVSEVSISTPLMVQRREGISKGKMFKVAP